MLRLMLPRLLLRLPRLRRLRPGCGLLRSGLLDRRPLLLLRWSGLLLRRLRSRLLPRGDVLLGRGRFDDCRERQRCDRDRGSGFEQKSANVNSQDEPLSCRSSAAFRRTRDPSSPERRQTPRCQVDTD